MPILLSSDPLVNREADPDESPGPPPSALAFLLIEGHVVDREFIPTTCSSYADTLEAQRAVEAWWGALASRDGAE